MAEVLPRMRAREKIWTVTAEDEMAMRMFREQFPRERVRERADESDDSFDAGVGTQFPRHPVEISTVPSGSNGVGAELSILSRSRWQVRYMVAKAKLMLVEEEGKMRRRRLAELMVEEKRLLEVMKAEGSREAA